MYKIGGESILTWRRGGVTEPTVAEGSPGTLAGL